MAVWSHNRYITGLLILVILGHWSLILQGALPTPNTVIFHSPFPPIPFHTCLLPPPNSHLNNTESNQMLTAHAGVLLRATWVPGTGCVITSTNTTVLAATFIYSMAFDLIVLILNAYKLLGVKVKRGKGEAGAMASSRLGRLIFGDGLIFFFIA